MAGETGGMPNITIFFKRIVPALIFPYIFKGTLDLWYFPWILLISLAGALAGTLLTKPTDEATLKSFYRTVNPWGFWKPVKQMVLAENPDFKPNKNFGIDMFNVFIGTAAQTALMALPIYIVLQKQTPIIITILITVISAFILKKTWWDKLPEK